ncbi:uncharacterized protein [Palaemon carinicauda]|uniref:uncharacterized protein n=1 Tax=Palaemon carinicauda TaxID=392227 RepID=UPI0035B65B54
MFEHHKLVKSKMKSEYFGQIQKSTTLFPQRLCNPPESKKGITLANDDLPLKSNPGPLENDSNKENKKGVCKESPEIVVKSEIDDGICENTDGRNSYAAVPTDTELIMCFVCNKEIVYEYLSEHLLIGHVKCIRCSIMFTSCKYFQEWSVERDIGMSVCNHMLQYLENPWETLNDYHSKVISNTSQSVKGEVENKVQEYLNSIKSLQNRYPWREIFYLSDKYNSKIIEVPRENVALDCSFDKFISEATAGNSNPRECCGAQVYKGNKALQSNLCQSDVPNSDSIPITVRDPVPEKNGQKAINNDNSKAVTNDELTKNCLSVKKKCNSLKKSSDQFLKGKKRKVDLSDGESKRKVLVSQTKKSSKYIETPSDGFYYIAKDSVKECPNCYTAIKPEDFSVNIVTFLMTAICSDCGLTIYVVDDPSPDDECPRICIVTDQKPVIKKQ